MPKHNLRLSLILSLSMLGVFIIDQNIKMLFVDGFRYYTDCIDLILVYNKGVAFSMFSFLAEYLKYIQLVLVVGILGYVFYLKKVCYAFPAGLLLGGAFSNVYDRFIHGGVVDMVYWHCGFNFAVFNFADVMIDVAVVWILVLNFKKEWCKN
ncbi:MAG: lipoprotein signal peptidase [Epsilonproteobacteria bacterium]|nr:lipoprotein signal peptidase [Campylobacterota bacterium]OIO16875.1 MAG: signal peptidase II [Helicobacteraceae bacterium CG1_02_36_14]PIP09209.1 MAG: signal peptidase II [Sulfurimonas sp. CG23_combo_of_CG06-09_8_20_14_all_36_33]PIS24622.1 MAG: lipoprotein signal peptidase [Sulfurimonas sp. CG08_land_8_20_14_0_20_36_33]PIU34971.1 MAG: lipoprotein signal peptidase [Sulfurimonas sp. CG07_land_8_20_14_0_80_36_56]PIV02951.1 MAG: lipoprotein signal peptidase [Sulfurimonas sp. CG03_land_8_20_14_0